VIYQQHWHPPKPQPQNVPGEWRAETWPPRLDADDLYLQPDHRLSPAADRRRARPASICSIRRRRGGFGWESVDRNQRPVDAFS